MDQMVQKPKFLKCFITNITAAGDDIEIWCQTDAKRCSRVKTSLDAFHRHLSDLFATNSLLLSKTLEPQVGKQFLTHMDNDLHFYRVVVTHTDIDSSRALVSAIDFGGEFWVPFKHLVTLDQLFAEKPLAQRFYLADIRPKDNEWYSEDVQSCLQQFLMTSFQCEVIQIAKNTECIRVYDQSFNQPLIEKLVKYCGGIVSYNSCADDVLKALDLTGGDSKSPVKSVPTPIKLDLKPIKVNTNSLEVIDKKGIPIKENSEDDVIKSLDKFSINSIPKSIELHTNLMQVMDKNAIELKENKAQDLTKALDQNKGDNKSSSNSISKCIELNTNSMEVLDKNGFELKGEENRMVKALDQTEGDDKYPINSVPKPIESELKSIVLNTNSVKEMDKNGIELNEENSAKDVTKALDQTDGDDKSPINSVLKPIELDINSMEVINKSDIGLKGENSSDGVLKVVDQSEGDDNSSTNSVPKPIMSDIKPNELDKNCIELNGRNKIYVTCVCHSDHTFYAQLVSNYEEIDGLTGKMSDFYNNSENSLKYSLDVKCLKVNDVIACLYSADNLWYRASVKAIKGKDFSIFYIDFGNDDLVDGSKCRTLAEEFVGLKAQAIHCSFVDEISLETQKQYENDMNEVVCDVIAVDGDVTKVKIIDVK